MRTSIRSRNGQCGIAIVLAMSTVALAAVAATAIVVTQSPWVRQSELSASHVQARTLVQAGVDWACAVLHEDRRSSSVDQLGEPWALRLAPMPVENGKLAGFLEDQQGLFNLNNIVKDGKVIPEQLAQFRRLLSILGFPDVHAAAMADALADWIDADDVPRLRGAEDEYYLSMQPPYSTSNRPLTDVAELALVRGFDANARARLRPFVSALPRFTAVNVNTAPPEVLAAITSGLGLDGARLLVTRRDSSYFRNRSDFLEAIPRGATIADSDITVSSDYFRVSLHVTIGDAQANGVALLHRPGTAWPTIVWRKLS